jgi:hypothetical protein
VPDCFLTSLWTGTNIQMWVLIPRLDLIRIIQSNFDDSYCVKDKDTRELRVASWHHDHTASAETRKVDLPRFGLGPVTRHFTRKTKQASIASRPKDSLPRLDCATILPLH